MDDLFEVVPNSCVIDVVCGEITVLPLTPEVSPFTVLSWYSVCPGPGDVVPEYVAAQQSSTKDSTPVVVMLATIDVLALVDVFCAVTEGAD